MPVGRMLARRASRRVQSSHAATSGIKKPWLYSSWVVQRLTSSNSASRNAITASSVAMQPNIHVRIGPIFGKATDCTDIMGSGRSREQDRWVRQPKRAHR